jgi:hypothetical protein
MLQNFLSGERALLRNGGGVGCCGASNGSAEAPTPRPFKMEADVTPKNGPDNFVSPTLLFFSFIFCMLSPEHTYPLLFYTHTLLKLPCPSQKDTRETAVSIRAGKNTKIRRCAPPAPSPAQQPRRLEARRRRDPAVLLPRRYLRGKARSRLEQQQPAAKGGGR